MKYLVTAAEMKRYEENTIKRIGIPGLVLMERAAFGAYREVMKVIERCMREAEHTPTVLVMAGVGNNGGDGLALARMLAESGIGVKVWIVGDEGKATDSWRCQRQILSHYPVLVDNQEDTKNYTICVDALFGVGLSREVGGIYADAIEQFNKKSGFKIALDIPSGLNADTGEIRGCAVWADLTLTFGFCKRGLVTKQNSPAGQVVTVPMGIGEQSFFGEKPGAFYYDEPVRELLPVRDVSGNKGTFGKGLLIAGSHNMAGAALLAAKAAYRSGVGMVKLITSSDNRVIVQETLPEALLGSYEEEAAVEESLEWADVIAIGPGLSGTAEALRALKTVITQSEKPLVIDADGLNLLAGNEELRATLASSHRCAVLTPHVGELARLTGKDISVLKNNLAEEASKLSASLHKIIVAKDARTYICAEGMPICVNLAGNSGMATAGSGDVLCGVIAGLLAQGMDGFHGASVGVYLHACGGDAAADRLGERGCMAGDIVDALGCL